MKSIVKLMSIAGLILTFFAIQTNSAQASCTIFDVTGPGSASYTIVAGQSYIVFAYDSTGALVFGTPFTVTANVSGTFTGSVPSGYREVITVAGCFDGPGIPSGFVLKTITCTTAVFDSAGGNPVAGAVITAGQTWFVSPTPVKDAKGKLWTETFVSGTPNGFVPTSCVS